MCNATISATEPQAAPTARRPRWYRLTPDRSLVALLAVEGLLLLSERFRWFAFNEKKGWTVLIAVAAVGVALTLLLIWFAAAVLLRRRFQFSIRSLLVLVLAVAIPCSWLATKRQQAARQREAYDVLRKFGHVSYDFPSSSRPAEPAPAWLRKMLGDDFFVDVEFICFGGGPEFGDVELAYVGDLSALKSFTCFDGAVTDAGMVHLNGLTNLQFLFLGFPQITDAGLVHLKGLTNLRSLSLDCPRITDAGLEHLAGFTQLEELSLSDTQVTDESVKKLHQTLANCRIHRW
jgi:hypothetical protein